MSLSLWSLRYILQLMLSFLWMSNFKEAQGGNKDYVQKCRHLIYPNLFYTFSYKFSCCILHVLQSYVIYPIKMFASEFWTKCIIMIIVYKKKSWKFLKALSDLCKGRVDTGSTLYISVNLHFKSSNKLWFRTGLKNIFKKKSLNIFFYV